MGVVATLIRDPRYRLALIGLCALAFIELLLSDSRTPLLSLVLSAAAMIAANFLYRPSRWQRNFTQGVRNGIVALGVLFAGVIVPLTAALTLAALGRDLTLSGRTHLWEYAIGKGIDRPWLGVGYKSFWTDSVTFDLRTLHDHWSTGEGTKALTANAHNGFLEVWLDLGFVGLALLLALFAVAAFKANRQLKQTRDPVYIWHIGAITYVASYYLTESGVMQQNTTSWFVLSYAFLSICAQEIRDKKTSRIRATSWRKPIVSPSKLGILQSNEPKTYS
jgi:exopolysaccharide production protein ExoQ